MSSQKNLNVELTIFGVVQVIFLILKLTGEITWNWWAICSPVLLLLFICIAALFIVEI